MNIINKNTLSAKELAEVHKLEAICRNAENLSGSLFLSPELNEYPDFPCFFLLYDGDRLASFLSVFIPSEYEAEISVCTHPDYRRQGLCSTLIKEASELLLEYDISDLTFVTEPGAHAFLAVLDKLSATLINSEYLMKYESDINNDVPSHLACDDRGTASLPDASDYELVIASREALEAHIRLHHRAFDTEYCDSEAFVSDLLGSESIKAFAFKRTLDSTLIGCCYLDVSSANTALFGVCIDPDYQNMKLGKLMLKELLNRHNRTYNRPIILQVSGDNPIAKHMYESLGFTVASQFDYWTLSI